VKTECILV